MRFFQRTLVEAKPLSHRLDGFFLTDNALGQMSFSQCKAIARVAKNHVAGDSRLLRDHIDHMLGFDDHRVRFVDLDFYRGGVQPPDRFVRQVQAANVLGRHLQRDVNCFIGNLDRIVFLESRPNSQQDLPGLADGRLVNFYQAETARQGFVFADILFVFGYRGGANDAQIAFGQR